MILVGSLTVLPSLSVVLSYVQQQMVQPQEAALQIVHSDGKARARAAKKDRLPVSPGPTEGTSKVVIADELAGSVAQFVLDPPKGAEVVYAPARPTNFGQDTAGAPESPDNTTNPSGSVGGQHKPGMKQPTVTSIILGAAHNIPWGDHAHDHDDH